VATELPELTVVKGTCYPLFAYDIAQAIDLDGAEQRILVAGIAEAYEPESLVGRSVVVVFNLKPAKLMGVESNGMVLAASPDGGKPTLVTFEDPPPPGTRVR